jgi:ParB family chromosome partitioning protein
MKRRALGKGIEAIISNKQAASGKDGFQEIDIDNIYPNPFQPRKDFSEEKIRELAESLKESGLVQPVVVYKENERYYLVVGERRWRAAQFLKWKKIPALIKEFHEDDIMVNALAENIQREDLNAIEIAEGIDLLISKTGMNHEKVANKLGMNRTTVTNYLRLLKLPNEVKSGIISGRVSQGHARPLLSLQNNEDIMSCYSKIQKNRLSVRQAESLIKNFTSEREKVSREKDPDILKTESKLSRHFSTKVTLKYSDKGKGSIEIFFTQLEEFQRIFKILLKE